MSIALVEVQVFSLAPNILQLLDELFVICFVKSDIIKAVARWRVGGAVTQRSAKPFRRVRLSYVPPIF